MRKTPNCINMNKKPLLQVDIVQRLVEFTSLYEDTTTKVYKYVATADIEIRNFRKIRFSLAKIKVIQQIAIHLCYPCFVHAIFIRQTAIHWIGDLSIG
jgi:hypothetical protein